MTDKAILQTIYTKGDKANLITDKPEKLIHAIANRPKNETWDERLLGYNIQIDGNMAHV